MLAGRRAFRRIPDERLRLADYASPRRTAADLTYVTRAALLEDWEFDRVRFRVSGSGYRAADPAHWLALEVAAAALEDAGFPDGAGLPRESAGVLVGNSLTGEFSRAGLMRLRWPYVRRVLDASLAEAGWGAKERRGLLAGTEARYKAPFPPVGEETLGRVTGESGVKVASLAAPALPSFSRNATISSGSSSSVISQTP